MSKRIFQNLRIKLLCAVMISLFIGITVFFGSFMIGERVLNKTVYSDSYSDKMTPIQYKKLQKYIDKHEISLTNLQKLNAWGGRGAKVYLAIYENNALIYESRIYSRINSDFQLKELSPHLDNQTNQYILTLKDGVKVRAFLYYYAGDAFYFSMIIISIVLAFMAFALCFINLINRKIKYISSLKRELDILSGGQLEYPVTISGNDELGELASGIDQMRRSIIKHQELEDQMRSSNSELITAMSHDLRTPLTSLLAYLEIIERKKYSNDEQMHELIQKSLNQTMRIKQMADKLFEYFLAYATEWESADTETMDANQLFTQIFSDYAYALESNGLKVETNLPKTQGHIKINTSLLQRALDNLYSNILKYADPNEPIKFACSQSGNHFCISISNSILKKQEKLNSTKIGLITCRRIIEYHKGTFTISEKGNVFEVVISLPLAD